MNIHEYQAKQLFKDYQIPVPEGKQVTKPEQAELVARALDGEGWVVKAQVHAGGRGKVGGVKLANSLKEVKEISASLLGQRLVTQQTGAEGLPINSLLIEKIYPIKRELYLSLVVDRASQRLMFIASSAGGMDIEKVAHETPEQIVSVPIHPAAGLQGYQCRKIGFALGLKGAQLRELEKIMTGLYQLFLAKDASQIEINPLIETDSGELLALDAKINFDDNALALHPDIAAMQDPEQEDPKENEAQQFGLNYITLSGNIGCMVNGAGLAMATMDLVKLKGGLPANFLDVGGGTTVEKVSEAFKLILSDPEVKAVLVNIFGGIVQCDVIAQGILAAVEQVHVTVPVVVRLEGTHAEQGRELLAKSGVNIVAADDLEHAAEQVVALAKGR
ncbi:MAG: ADP-forming succinate--CoA ligase subunit beta [Methylococcaceae bacterium]|nr:ADP-forming succinate--CoA ligase subunit beta [Methylococcaceae bacterium]MDP2392977.1 ADP-forming succinate--CoA ligase subunit beta [Methylococcaceae bacterium]MDP3020461.1 ADP-forming succinate--CoA ligase subunit beta [Methylococcaceae bacterium]MDP3389824.1 ADP-forming succinate--CoA ligase subunit beta [Methylococcaceae bacterium]MDP3931054.1 ADP-forming succinate--CoA ligase subunit beta [Methylococcaceae bacterium]